MTLAARTESILRTALANKGAAKDLIDHANGTITTVTTANIASPAAITLTPTTDTLLANGTGLVVGHTTQLTISDGDGATNLIPETQVLGTAKADASVLIASFNTTNDATVAPSLNFLKGGNAAIGSNTIVASGEILGEITAFGDDGADYEAPAAQIQFVVAATPGAGDMPGRVVIRCTTDGGETLAEVGRFEVATGLTLGVAGTSLGKLTLSGNTSGTVIVQTAAAAGSWTFTLPPDDGDAGEQLQTNGSGVSTWEAAGSMRAVKEVVENLSGKASEALDRMLSRDVYAFRYKENARQETGLPALSDTKTVFHGIMAEEYGEAMMWGGKIFNPISAFGETVLAIKALAARVAELEAAQA